MRGYLLLSYYGDKDEKVCFGPEVKGRGGDVSKRGFVFWFIASTMELWDWWGWERVSMKKVTMMLELHNAFFFMNKGHNRDFVRLS